MVLIDHMKSNKP